jgi:hypothetical protein
MAVTRVTTWVANDILTAAALNAEFNICMGASGQNVSFPRTANADFNGLTLILDADTDTTLRASTDDVIDVAIGGTDTFQFTATELTILGKRVLTTADGARLYALLPRIGTVEARVSELSASGFLASQLNNF